MAVKRPGCLFPSSEPQSELEMPWLLPTNREPPNCCHPAFIPPPQLFTDGYGAPGDQAFPGRKMQPGQSSMLGAVTASLKIYIPIFVIIVCLGGRPPGLLPSSLLRPPPPAVSPQEHAFLRAFPGRGPDPLLPHAGACVRTPFLCACGGYLGAGETAGSPGL